MLDLLQPLLQQARKQKRGRKAKPKPVFVSRKIELQYAKELLAISAMCQAEAAQLVIPEVSKNIGDAWFSDAVKALKNKVSSAVDTIAEKLAIKTVNAQKKQADDQLAQQLEKMTGVHLKGLFRDEDLKQVVEEAIAANVTLIKSIPGQYADQIEAAILRGLQEGKRAEAIKKDILAIGHSTDDRALLIARDQLGKINSRISQVRQKKLGITHYTWETSHDERVRSSHRLRNGKIYAWDDPPSDGHPGQPIRCRCVAIPYMEHLLNSDAPTPEQAMVKQKQATGNTGIDAAFKQVDSKRSVTEIKQQSKSLLADHSGDLTRTDLPHGSDNAPGWTSGIMGLRKSEQVMRRLVRQGKEVPASWAIHHWSIDSSFLVDRYRKSSWLDDAARKQMQAATDQADTLIKNLFKDKRSVLANDVVLYRGIDLNADIVKDFEKRLLNNEVIEFMEASFNSNTNNPSLAKVFASQSARRNGGVPVIHKTIVKKDVKGIDITELNYYDEDEILIDSGYIREIIAMRRLEDGTVEMHSVMKPKPGQVGDAKPRSNDWIEINSGHPNDAHLNKVSGVAASYRSGGSLKDYKF